MATIVVPVLQDLRALYDIPDRMDRFRAYVDLLSGKTRGEQLPIGNFSPMGRRQAEYLDSLIKMGAEYLAQKAVNDAVQRLGDFQCRIILVVVDEPKNGWTQRSLTDADWRFNGRTDSVPKSKTEDLSRKWISVQLWTDIEPTAAYIGREVSTAIYRFVHRQAFGFPKSLKEMLDQEGRSLAFAGACPEVSATELTQIHAIVSPYLNSQDYPICFAALYGDDAACAVGYDPLGLRANAGFDLAVSLALRDGIPDLSLTRLK